MEELLFKIRVSCGMTYYGKDRDSQKEYSQMLHMANTLSNEVRVFSGDVVSCIAAAIYLSRSSSKLAAWTTYGQYVSPPKTEDDIDQKLLKHLKSPEQVKAVREMVFDTIRTFQKEWERQLYG